MHQAARRDLRGSTPPVLHVERLGPDAVRVQYISARRMGALAVGILRGLARHFGEENLLRITPTTREHGEHGEHGEHVDILVERIARPAPAEAPAAE